MDNTNKEPWSTIVLRKWNEWNNLKQKERKFQSRSRKEPFVNAL